MTELWRTTGVSLSAFPTAFLSATASGSMVVSLQLGTSTAEALVLNASGTPTGSYDVSGTMSTRALVGSGGGLWFALDVTNPGMGLASLQPTFQPWPVASICGASWLKGHAGATGVLHTAAVGCNAITNNGFETGNLFDWTTSGAAENVTTASAHAGYFGTMLGQTTPTNGDSTVQQTFTVPSGGGTLSFYWSNTCPDSVYYDWFTATLQNTSGATLATIVSNTCTATPSWTHATLNLASWAGQQVVVVLTSHDDNYPGDPTYSYVDDIQVQ